jgi:polysaccharide export outer membrane protein
VRATIPLQQLVSDPGEDIYADPRHVERSVRISRIALPHLLPVEAYGTYPGDVLTLIRLPQTFSVFGATGRDAEIPFDANTINLAEALGKLRDDLAKPEGLFLFRNEPTAIVRALDPPPEKML